MKLRAWWPAIAGIAFLVAILAFVKRGGDDDAPRSATAIATPSTPASSAPKRAPAKPVEPAQPAIVPTSPDEATEDDLAQKRPLSPDELKVETPDVQPKKAKMTLDERLAEAQKHIPVLERRAELIDQDIAKLEAAGKTKEAAEQKVVAARLRSHADELKKAIAEHREPM